MLLRVISNVVSPCGGRRGLSPAPFSVYTAEPDSETEQALNLLGSWAATLAEEHAAVSAALAPRDTERL
jgi:hypothetical protein